MQKTVGVVFVYQPPNDMPSAVQMLSQSPWPVAIEMEHSTFTKGENTRHLKATILVNIEHTGMPTNKKGEIVCVFEESWTDLQMWTKNSCICLLTLSDVSDEDMPPRKTCDCVDPNQCLSTFSFLNKLPLLIWQDWKSRTWRLIIHNSSCINSTCLMPVLTCKNHTNRHCVWFHSERNYLIWSATKS